MEEKTFGQHLRAENRTQRSSKQQVCAKGDKELTALNNRKMSKTAQAHMDAIQKEVDEIKTAVAKMTEAEYYEYLKVCAEFGDHEDLASMPVLR